jgi:hypothetical protein
MKKCLLILLACVGTTIGLFAQVWPCTPDPNLNYNGISPAELPFAMAGYEYWTSLSFKIPKDSSINQIAVTIDSARFLYASGRPVGFEFFCNTPRCVWKGGEKGCALFYGKVDSTFSEREFPMKIYTQTWYRFTGGTDQFSRIDSATNYRFKIVQYNNLIEVSQYEPLTIYPNPVKEELHIELRDANNQPAMLTILDNKGRTVYQNDLNPTQFLHTVNIDMSQFSKGLYYVKLTTDGKQQLAKVNVF